ncbi:hypothetical protein BU24DRAFT_141735 [Aaosphaeria arxii CBS 175.79]|uniref:Uncharacterized protein n=1 Tax=Aaosphaeria arxii CBS 175.79 TaxID=1450172 RepID=A0A6A5XVM6_9PLEO|nr:uncharacterized protein BU24DRAFT_141735 [Aaosphaeria arxii CBS 175.79]KAF2016993.1 hypothetical protein BU24DRAFT_141735 [Aaosphaeria arxii CBS 175.79]
MIVSPTQQLLPSTPAWRPMSSISFSPTCLEYRLSYSDSIPVLLCVWRSFMWSRFFFSFWVFSLSSQAALSTSCSLYKLAIRIDTAWYGVLGYTKCFQPQHGMTLPM